MNRPRPKTLIALLIPLPAFLCLKLRNRRRMNRLIPVCVAAAAMQLLSPITTSAAKPNIVVILADDMNRHHPGFNGGPVSTPNLDRLTREGTRLTQFYVHAVCSPTRAAFLTGRYPFRIGMEERSHGNDVAGMLTDERTLAAAFQGAGYFTAIIGKWHLGNWHKRHLPMQRGFDYQYGLYGALISYYGKARDRYYDWHRNEQTIREEGYSTDLIARECGRVIASHDGKKGSLYQDLMRAVAEARKISQPEFCGFVWRQAKADGTRRDLAEEYYDTFKQLIADLRTDLGAPKLPVFILAHMSDADLLKNVLSLMSDEDLAKAKEPAGRSVKDDDLLQVVLSYLYDHDRLVCWPASRCLGTARAGRFYHRCFHERSWLSPQRTWRLLA